MGVIIRMSDSAYRKMLKKCIESGNRPDAKGKVLTYYAPNITDWTAEDAQDALDDLDANK